LRRLAPVPRFIPLIAFVVVVLLLGMWVGGRHSDWLPGPVRDALVGDSDTAVVKEAIDRVHDTYYRQIPKSALADDAIAGVVSKLGDRFSNYFDPAQYKRFKDAQNSEFSGVGLQVSRHPKGLRVDAVYDGSPAKRAGLHQGDVIVAADGHDLAGLSQQESVGRVKGPPGSQVRLTWVRGAKRYTKTVSRSTVTVPVVASQLRSSAGCQVGVVRLSQFSSGAHADVYAALRKLQKRGAKVFVLDLRDNGGGLVSEAQLIASAFLKDGPIVTTRGRAVKEQTLRATGDPVVPTAPMSVLVNGDTASASEIVTGALQDRDRAKVVGTETFGKGVFQEVLELSNGGALDITAGQYFTPKGRNLGGKGVSTGKGIIPDVRAKDDPKTKTDEGLDRAMAVAGAKCPS
jgi:carboxyl-terminal processing protease